jgi:large subunit ribosomal protein L28
MARRCTLSGKGVLTGNNVSHANNKTRRRFLPNLQSRRLFSEALGETVRLRIAASTLRTIEKRGGLDGYLLAASSTDLRGDLVRLRQRIIERQAQRAA